MNENEEFEFALALEQERKTETTPPEIGLEARAERAQNTRAGIEAMDAAGPTPPPPENPSFMDKAAHLASGWNKGVSGIIDLPHFLSSIPKMVGEYAGVEGAEDWPAIPSWTEIPGAKKLDNRLTRDFIDPTENKGLDAGKTAASWAVPLPIAKAKTVMNVAPDLLMGAGAGLGKYAGSQYSEDAGNKSEVAGGVAGLVASLLRGRLPVAKPTRQAADFVTEALKETPDAQAKLTRSLATDDIGTLADRVESPAAYNIEDTLAHKGSPLRAAIEDSVHKAETKAQSTVIDRIPAAPTAPAKLAAEQRGTDIKNAAEVDRSQTVKQVMQDADTTKAAALADEARLSGEMTADQARVNALRTKADAAQGTLASQPHTADASTIAHEEIAKLDDQLRTVEKAAWKKIEDSPPIDVSGAVAGLKKHINTLGLAPTDAGKLRKAYKTELDTIASWGKKTVKPVEVQAVLRDMKQKIHDAGITGKTPFEHQKAGDIVKYVEDMLVKTPTTAGFKEAVAATVDRYARAKPENVGKVRNNPATETYIDRLSLKGNKGANTAKNVLASRDLDYIESVHNSLRAEGKAAKGGVDQAFMDAHSGYLKEFPSLKNEMQKIADSNTAATVGAKESVVKQKGLSKALTASEKGRDSAETALTRALDEVNKGTDNIKAAADKGPVATFSKDAEGRIHTLLGKAKGDASTKELTQLHDWAKTEGVGDSFKGLVREQLNNRLFPETGKGLRLATGKSVNAFNEIKQRLIDSGILTAADVKVIDAQLKGVVKKQVAREVAGDIDIAPTVTARESAMASAAALGAVATTGVPHALIATSFTKKYLVQLVKDMKLTPQAQAEIAGFMTNPEKYVDAFEKLKAARGKGGKLSHEKRMDVIRAVLATSRTNDADE